MLFCPCFIPTHLVLVGLPFLIPLPPWCSVTTFSPPTWSLLDSLSSFPCPHDVLSLLFPHPPGPCWTPFPHSSPPMMFCPCFIPTHLVFVGLGFLVRYGQVVVLFVGVSQVLFVKQDLHHLPLQVHLDCHYGAGGDWGIIIIQHCQREKKINY